MAKEEFEIKDGVLVKYNGNGGDVVIPEGVTSIDELDNNGRVFYNNIDRLVLPKSLKDIMEYTFCDINLKELVIHGNIEASIIERALASMASYDNFISEVHSDYSNIDTVIISNELVSNVKHLKMNFAKGFCKKYRENPNQPQEMIDDYKKYISRMKNKIFEEVKPDINILYFMMQYELLPLENLYILLQDSKNANNIELTEMLEDHLKTGYSKKELEKYNNDSDVIELKRFWKYVEVDGGIEISKYIFSGNLSFCRL